MGKSNSSLKNVVGTQLKVHMRIQRRGIRGAKMKGLFIPMQPEIPTNKWETDRPEKVKSKSKLRFKKSHFCSSHSSQKEDEKVGEPGKEHCFHIVVAIEQSLKICIEDSSVRLQE